MLGFTNAFAPLVASGCGAPLHTSRPVYEGLVVGLRIGDLDPALPALTEHRTATALFYLRTCSEKPPTPRRCRAIRRVKIGTTSLRRGERVSGALGVPSERSGTSQGQKARPSPVNL